MTDLPAHALLTNAEMAAADRATIDGGRLTGPELMDRAGAAVARLALVRFPGAGAVHVLCGPGNNGGDGYVAARILSEAGVNVRLHALAPPKPGTDAEAAARGWRGAAEPLDIFAPTPGGLVIDALFGAGFSGRLPDPVRQALQRAAAACPILAVDLPSGVNGDTGQGADALACAATVTFYRRKPGHLLFPGRRLCGHLEVADIGVRAAEDAATAENVPALWRQALPRPAIDTHKYDRGAVAVLSGPRHGSGASRLSAVAAQRAGAGAVTLVGRPDALDVHAAHVTSIMLRPLGDDPLAALAALKGLGAVVLGPGLGDAELARRLAPPILARTGAALVLDADGVTAFAERPGALFEAAAAAPGRLVMTPHPGEFARLFAELAGDDTLGKLDRARRAAALSSAVVVYKGADTVIAAPDGRAAINANATPALATAGSGDVLAGVIAALLAQGMPAYEAAGAAVWLHGEAGRHAGPFAIAEDIAAAVPAVFGGLMAPDPTRRP